MMFDHNDDDDHHHAGDEDINDDGNTDDDEESYMLDQHRYHYDVGSSFTDAKYLQRHSRLSSSILQ